jgi:hypothetical protein
MTKVEIIELYIKDLESKVRISPARNNRIDMLKEELEQNQGQTLPIDIDRQQRKILLSFKHWE